MQATYKQKGCERTRFPYRQHDNAKRAGTFCWLPLRSCPSLAYPPLCMRHPPKNKSQLFTIFNDRKTLLGIELANSLYVTAIAVGQQSPDDRRPTTGRWRAWTTLSTTCSPRSLSLVYKVCMTRANLPPTHMVWESAHAVFSRWSVSSLLHTAV